MLTSHLWSLSGAGGGSRAPPLTRRRLHRGSWTLLRAMSPGDASVPAALCVARSDAHTAEVWWPVDCRLVSVDLALLSSRTLPRANGACVGHAADVTAIAADVAAAAVWTGHKDGSVACWGTASGMAVGSRTIVLPHAWGCGPVAHLVLATRGTVWVAGARTGALRAVSLRSQSAQGVARGSSYGPPSSADANKAQHSFEDSSSFRTNNEQEALQVLFDIAWMESDVASSAAGAGGPRAAALASSPGDAMRPATWVWGARAGEDALCTWNAHTGELAARWSCASMGPVAALASWPHGFGGTSHHHMEGDGDAAHAANSPPALVSAHRAGGVHIWAALGAPLARVASAGPHDAAPPCGLALVCGLAAVAHGDGILRVWPLAMPTSSSTSTWGPLGLPAGTLRAHRSGMRACCAVEGDALGGGDVDTDGGMITCGRSGSVALWPASELIAAVATEPAAAAAVAAWRAARSGTPKMRLRGRRGDVDGGGGGGGTHASVSVVATQPPPQQPSASQQEASGGSFAVALPAPGTLTAFGSLPATPREAAQPAPVTPSSQRALAARIIPFSEVTLRTVVGEGSYGTVYQGTWMSTEVAVKMWRVLDGPSAGGGANATSAVAEGLVAEVAVMQELRHPNIVMLLGVTTDPPAIVQEYCGRGSLYGVLRRHAAPGAPPLAWRVRLQMVLGAATGMCYLHGCRPVVLHRDLKSPNLLVDRHWRVKVGDFGLSRVTMSSVAVASVPGIHSPRWMAPEVLVDGRHSKASDVFSFAVVLWELATLLVPWDGANQWQVMHAVADEKARCPVPETVTPPFTTGWTAYCDLMNRSWAHDPVERPSFAGIVADLQAMLDALMASERPSMRNSQAQSQGGNSGGAVAGADDPSRGAPRPSTSDEGGEAQIAARAPQQQQAVVVEPVHEVSPRKRPQDWTPTVLEELHSPPAPRPAVKSNTAPLRIPPDDEAPPQGTQRALPPLARMQHASGSDEQGAGADGVSQPPPPPPPAGVAAKAVAARTAAKARRNAGAAQGGM